MRAACIDIGSNTTRLLVAERDPRRSGALVEVAARRTFVRLSARERTVGLPPHKLRAIADAVEAHAATARARDAAALRVVATAALRGLPGLDALLEHLSAAAGVPVEVLAPEDEARLAFAGATAGLDAGGGTVVVADIGGGSTELAAGTVGGEVHWWASVAIGSGSLADAHLRGDPPGDAELSAAIAVARTAIAAVGCPRADQALAVGGSATSLRRLCGEHLTVEALGDALSRVCAGPADRVARELGLHEERVRLLPAALILLSEVARATGGPLRVGCGGLREGVVLDLLARVG